MNQGTTLFQIGTLYFQPNAIKLNQMTETLPIDFFSLLWEKIIFPPPTLLSSYCRKKWCRGGCQRHSHCVWLCGTYLQFPFRWFSQSALHHYFVRQANKLCSRPLQKNGDTRKIRLFSRLLWFASSVKCLCQKKKKSYRVCWPFTVCNGMFHIFCKCVLLSKPEALFRRAFFKWFTTGWKEVADSLAQKHHKICRIAGISILKPRASSSDLKLFQSVLVLNN